MPAARRSGATRAFSQPAPRPWRDVGVSEDVRKPGTYAQARSYLAHWVRFVEWRLLSCALSRATPSRHRRFLAEARKRFCGASAVRSRGLGAALW